MNGANNADSCLALTTLDHHVACEMCCWC